MSGIVLFRPCAFALSLNSPILESLRFGELTRGVLTATALLISAGKLKM